jgi:hypothetical protein
MIANMVDEWNESNNCLSFTCSCDTGDDIGWCCVLGNIFTTTNNACHIMNGVFFQDYSIAESFCNAKQITPDIKINGQDDTLDLPYGSTPTLGIALDTGDFKGVSADWWLVRLDPDGIITYLNINDYPVMSWEEGVHTTYQGQLFDFPYVDFLSLYDLKRGTYHYYFGVDLIMNGNVDIEALYYDHIEINVE